MATEPDVKSCGIILFRAAPRLEFLLMKHHDRWDLPKGHVDPGETDLECALREMEEETGIASDGVDLDEQFRCELHYPIPSRKDPGRQLNKVLVIFLGRIREDREIVLTEHIDSSWVPWSPPHRIQERTIDPVLQAVEQYWGGDS